MNIGPLKIGDFLGIVIIALCIRTILHSVCSHLCIAFLPIYLFIQLIAAIGAIFSATDSVCTLQVWMAMKLWSYNNLQLTKKMLQKQSILFVQVLNQDETPLLYSLVFGEGVVNDATSVVLFNAIQSFDLSHFNSSIALQFIGNFLYLFITSTMLGVLVSLYLSLSLVTCALLCLYII